MAKFEITSPDGKKYEITAPEGATQEQVLAYAQKQFAAPQQPATAPEPTAAERIAGNPLTRFALGAASPLIGGAQFLANMSPIAQASGEAQRINEYIAQLEQMKQKGMGDGFDFAGLAGAVLNPGGLAAGKAIPAVAGVGKKIAQGATVGATAGATMPVTNPDNFAEQKTTQAVLGTVFGATLPAVVGMIRGVGGTVRDVADLVLPGGAQRIFEKYQQRIIGADPQVRARIIAALRRAEEYVENSKPTAAEAVADIPQASPMLSYQQIIAATPGGPSGQFGQRMADQEAARRAALQTVGKTPQELAAAEAARSTAAAQNYQQAFAQTIRANPELVQLSKDPFFKKALPDAIELAQSRGIDPKKNLTEFLHFVKIGMDRQLLPGADNAITNTQKSAIANTQSKLIDWLKKANPDYDAARADFAKRSVEIDRMKVGQSLENKLVTATEKETPASYALAVRNEAQTLKRATGQPRYDDLSQLLTPQEMQQVNSVLADVTRRSKAFNQPQRTNLYGGVNVAEETRPRLPNLLSRPAMIANFLLSQGGKKVEQEIDKIAADAYLNPNTLADIMEKLPTAKQNRLLDLLQKTQVQTTTAPIYATMQGQ